VKNHTGLASPQCCCLLNEEMYFASPQSPQDSTEG
jgi:hypothetical protein